MVKARALYDNHSETADELSFLRDDILEIIEKDYDGMEGWWLCGLRGKTGIAPANRLVIITVSDATSDYDLPPTKYGSFPTRRKPLVPIRDTALEDYDTPSKKYTTASKQDPQCPKASKTDVSSNDESEYDDYCVPSNKDESPSYPSKSPSPGMQSTNFQKYFTSYLKSEKDLSIVTMQITGMMKKWYDCSNYDSRAKIMKAVCVSYWKNIQAYISEAAKSISSIKGLVKPETFKSFEEVKQSGSDLENVLDHLNKFPTLGAEEKAKIEFLQQLSALTSNLSKNSQQLTDFFTHVEKEGLWLPSTLNIQTSTPVNGRRDQKARGRNLEVPAQSSPGRQFCDDYDTPLSKPSNIPPEKLLHSLSNSSMLVRNKSDNSNVVAALQHERKNSSICFDPNQSFEATDYDVPRSSDISDICTEAWNSSDQSRPTSSEFLDYDCPRPSTSYQKIKSMENLNSELSRSSMNEDQTDYDIPSNNSSVVRIRFPEVLKSGNRPGLAKSFDNDKVVNRSHVHLSFDGLDYDIPSSRMEIDQTQKYLHQMSQKERNLLKYYSPFVSEELKNLKALIELFQEHLRVSPQSREGAEPRRPLKLINDVKSLASCSHKVLFVIDSILKRIQLNFDLNIQLNFSCTKICEHLKNITNLVKLLSQPSSALAPLEKHLSSAVSEFQLHVQSIDKMVSHWK